MHVARHGRGTVLQMAVDERLEATAVHDGAHALTVFAVNRTGEPLALEARLHGFGTPTVAEHVVLADDDPRACNTAERPDRVVPRVVPGARVEGGALRAELPPRSWNVLRMRDAA
jgi:alpha-L-arabinofuranosidase